MVLDYFFDKNLVFCLEADNQEQLFDQVSIVTIYENFAIVMELLMPIQANHFS
ncbi:PTS system transporter subunit IIA [Streptococcus pneumoniae]|nr:PTS system transporter subunit IIA [Streptococcus pneumoniae]